MFHQFRIAVGCSFSPTSYHAFHLVRTNANQNTKYFEVVVFKSSGREYVQSSSENCPR